MQLKRFPVGFKFLLLESVVLTATIVNAIVIRIICNTMMRMMRLNQ